MYSRPPLHAIIESRLYDYHFKLYFLEVAHYYNYHSQTSIERYVCSPPDIQEYLEDIDISLQCTGTPGIVSKNMSPYFDPK